jgi:hypothetical protein
MALFQSAGRLRLFIVVSSNHARYGIMVSPLSFRISPGILSGPIDLCFPITATLFPMILVSVVKDLLELVHCIC